MKATAAAVAYATAVAFILRRGQAPVCAGRGAAIGLGVAAALVAGPLVAHYAFLGISTAIMAIDGSKELLTGAVVGAINGYFAAQVPA
jgi:hypothetical protein